MKTSNDALKNPRAMASIALKLAKFIDPAIFENKTPKFHIALLEFVFGTAKRKAVAVFRGASKTTLLNKVFVVAKIFLFNEPYILIVSESERKAKAFLRDIKRMVSLAQMLRLDISKGDLWSEESAEVRSGGKSTLIDVMARGQDPRGFTRNNRRPTLMILDDLERRELAASRDQREKLAAWLESDLYPALHPEGEIVFIGTIVHEDSELNKAVKSSEWQSVHIPVIEDGKSAWASRFPLERLMLMRDRLYEKGLHHVWYNEYLCLPRAAEKTLFNSSLFRYFDGVEWAADTTTLRLSNALEDSEIVIRKPLCVKREDGNIKIDTLRIYATMDLASMKGQDKSAIVVSGIDAAQRIYVLAIYAGYWNPHQKSVAVLRANEEWKPLRFGIEEGNALNDFFYTIDVAQKESGVRVPVEPLKHLGRNKQARIARLHTWFMTERVLFNRVDPNVGFLEAQLLAFDPEMEAKEDDIADAFAYVLDFLLGTAYESMDDLDEGESLWN
jgi:predicted phage terminase large subunit-like protein